MFCCFVIFIHTVTLITSVSAAFRGDEVPYHTYHSDAEVDSEIFDFVVMFRKSSIFSVSYIGLYINK